MKPIEADIRAKRNICHSGLEPVSPASSHNLSRLDDVYSTIFAHLRPRIVHFEATITARLAIVWGKPERVAMPENLKETKLGECDLLLRNASVIDGTGGPSRTEDVAISGDEIAVVVH